jgi:hypothetical protein
MPAFATGGAANHMFVGGGGGTPNLTVQNNNQANLYLDLDLDLDLGHLASTLGRHSQM